MLIPYATEQGMIPEEQGILAEEQGISAKHILQCQSVHSGANDETSQRTVSPADQKRTPKMLLDSPFIKEQIYICRNVSARRSAFYKVDLQIGALSSASLPRSETYRAKGKAHAYPRRAAALVALPTLRWRVAAQTD